MKDVLTSERIDAAIAALFAANFDSVEIAIVCVMPEHEVMRRWDRAARPMPHGLAVPPEYVCVDVPA